MRKLLIIPLITMVGCTVSNPGIEEENIENIFPRVSRENLSIVKHDCANQIFDLQVDIMNKELEEERWLLQSTKSNF